MKLNRSGSALLREAHRLTGAPKFSLPLSFPDLEEICKAFAKAAFATDSLRERRKDAEPRPEYDRCRSCKIHLPHLTVFADCLRAQRPSEAFCIHCILFTAESIADFATDSSPSQDVLQSGQSSIWASLGLAGISATGDSPNYRDGKTRIKDNKR